jgi:hypothetical protein
MSAKIERMFRFDCHKLCRRQTKFPIHDDWYLRFDGSILPLQVALQLPQHLLQLHLPDLPRRPDQASFHLLCAFGFQFHPDRSDLRDDGTLRAVHDLRLQRERDRGDRILHARGPQDADDLVRLLRVIPALRSDVPLPEFLHQRAADDDRHAGRAVVLQQDAHVAQRLALQRLQVGLQTHRHALLPRLHHRHHLALPLAHGVRHVPVQQDQVCERVPHVHDQVLHALRQTVQRQAAMDLQPGSLPDGHLR